MSHRTFRLLLSSARNPAFNFDRHQFFDDFREIRDKIGMGNGIGTRETPLLPPVMGLQII